MKKVKRLTAVILSALMMTSAFSVLPVSAAVIESNNSVLSSDYLTSGDYEYSLLDNGAVEISEYIGNDDDVTIPDTIDGKKVMSIGRNAFSSCKNLVSVEMSDNITSIGWGSFSACTNLKNVIISNSVISIDKYAFIRCTSLDNIIIPDSVINIGDFAFDDCENLNNITIPNSVLKIGSASFSGTPWYNNQTEGMIFAGKVLYNYKGDKSKITNIIIPDGTLSINDYIFNSCTNLKNITIPNSVINIGDFAFNGCTGLKDITIPSSVINIGNNAFADCQNLENILLSYGIEKIGDRAFSNCISLNEITIPDSVKEFVEDYGQTFYNCKNLKKINLSHNMTNITQSMFDGCESLTDIVIPNSVKEIGSCSFDGCNNLKNITLSNEIISISNGIFDDTSWYKEQPDGVIYLGNVLYAYKGEMPENTTINVADGTKVIADGAFYGCKNLKDIIIPQSIINIGSNALKNTSWLNTQPNGIVYVDKIAYGYKGEYSDNITLEFKNGTKGIANSFIGNFINRNNDNKINIKLIFPESIIYIGNNAFSGSSHYEPFVINCQNLPSNLEYICSYAFSYNKFNGTINNITIPNKIKYIGNKAFFACDTMKSVHLPNNDFTICDRTFGYSYAGYNNYFNVINFKLYGYKDTSAEKYAKKYNVTFFPLSPFTDKTLADTNTNITVSGVMQEDTVLNVAKLENTFENSVATYDITLQKDGAVIQPDSTITVKIPSNAENCKVMWLKDDGTAEDMNAKYTDGCYVFTTDHLSIYALVQDKTILTGDANQDGIIDVNDVTYLQMHIAGNKNTDGSAIIDETNKQLFDCVDMNKDGKLSVSDVTALQIYISNNNQKIN